MTIKALEITEVDQFQYEVIAAEFHFGITVKTISMRSFVVGAKTMSHETKRRLVITVILQG